MEQQEFLTLEELAKRFRVKRLTIRDWVQKGYLSALRLGPRTVRIRATDVEAWLESKKKGGK